jgi:hypothetical protein
MCHVVLIEADDRADGHIWCEKREAEGIARQSWSLNIVEKTLIAARSTGCRYSDVSVLVHPTHIGDLVGNVGLIVLDDAQCVYPQKPQAEFLGSGDGITYRLGELRIVNIPTKVFQY